MVQFKPISTGDAIWQARDLINDAFVVVGGHKADLTSYLPRLLEKFKEKAVLLGTETAQPWEFGMLKIENGKVAEIVENPKKGKEPSDIKTSETYIFPKDFFDYYARVPQKEDNFIDTINLLIKEKGADFILAEESPLSLKYPWQALEAMRLKLKSERFENYIDSTAVIGKNVVFDGKVYIGKKTVIGSNTIISGPCFIGNNCRIGASNVLRDHVNLEEGVVTGAFTELKNSLLQKGTHLHSGYFGDSIFGENCRVGAGFITANRRIDRVNIHSLVKGKKTDTNLTFFGAAVGNNSRFGIRAGTMPGVLIGSNCRVGPGTLIFDNIKDNKSFFTKFNNETS